MKQTLSFCHFADGISAVGPGNFTNEGLQALWDMLTDYEWSTGEEVEFDPIGLCCEFSEYASALEAAQEYGEKPDNLDDAIEYLNDHTMVWEGEGCIIIQQF